MPQEHSRPQNGPPSDERTLTLPLTLSVLAVFALIVAATFLPRAQLWGVNHLAFYPVPIRLVALLFMALLFIPPVARRSYSALLALSKTLRYGGARVDIALTVIAVLSVIVFTRAQTATNLLGDGQLIAQSFEAAWKGNEQVIMRNARAIVTEERIAPGATLMYYGAAKFFSAVFDKGPVWGIRLFNCLLGAFFIYIVLGLIRRGPFSSEIRLWLMVLALFSTSIQLYFGYMENYTPLLFVCFLYVLSGFLVLNDRGRLWIVIALGIVAIYTHIQAVLFVPALLYVILWRSFKRRRAAVERYVGPILTVVTIVGALVAKITPFGRFYLPLRGDEESYGLLSAVHVADVLNELLILMPILPLFLAMAWKNRSLMRLAPTRPEKTGDGRAGATGWFAKTAEWHFVFLILIPCLVYLFLFKPAIGMARDWDLFTMTALGFVPLALLIVNRFLRLTKMQDAAGLFSSPAIAIYLILGVAWVGINASPSRSTARFERILEYDKTHASYAYENLAIFYHERGQREKAAEVMETACEISRNPRQYVRLAMYYNDLGRVEEAKDLMYRTIGNHPDFVKARIYLLALLEKEKAFDEIFNVALDGTKHSPKEAIFWFYVGEVSASRGNIDEALNAFQTCLSLDPPEKARKRCEEQIRSLSGGGE